jgi:hypothetical protein
MNLRRRDYAPIAAILFAIVVALLRPQLRRRNNVVFSSRHELLAELEPFRVLTTPCAFRYFSPTLIVD